MKSMVNTGDVDLIVLSCRSLKSMAKTKGLSGFCHFGIWRQTIWSPDGLPPEGLVLGAFVCTTLLVSRRNCEGGEAMRWAGQVDDEYLPVLCRAE